MRSTMLILYLKCDVMLVVRARITKSLLIFIRNECRNNKRQKKKTKNNMLLKLIKLS